jgi:hypothetical protein
MNPLLHPLLIVLPAWAVMWVLCLFLYGAGKALTFHEASRRGMTGTRARVAGYLLAWPGMDALTFLDARITAERPTRGEWIAAVTKFLLGAILVWYAAGRFVADRPMVAGWVGMVGLIFLLHFGAFHLLSLAWRHYGVEAEPLMRAPLLATSLADFWGRRWNTAFHELVHRFTFRPLRRVAGARGATLVVFFVSGLVHELVISVPARGGYGGPTAYFLISGFGVLAEHSRMGRRAGLGGGWRGRVFTLTVTAGPVALLFHPPFVHHVILPLLRVIGAT